MDTDSIVWIIAITFFKHVLDYFLTKYEIAQKIEKALVAIKDIFGTK